MFFAARVFPLLLLLPACAHADGFLDMLSEGSEESATGSEITAEVLSSFFAEVNPAKVQGVAKLMQVYVATGHADELLKKLTAKYGEEPVKRIILDPIGTSTSSSAAGGSASTPAPSPSGGEGTEATPAGEGKETPAPTADALSTSESSASPLAPLEVNSESESSAASESSATASKPAPSEVLPPAAAGALTINDGALTLLIERVAVAVEAIAKAMEPHATPSVKLRGVETQVESAEPVTALPRLRTSLRGAKPGGEGGDGSVPGALRSAIQQVSGVRLPGLTAGTKPYEKVRDLKLPFMYISCESFSHG